MTDSKIGVISTEANAECSKGTPSEERSLDYALYPAELISAAIG